MSIEANDMTGPTPAAPPRPVVLVVEDEVLVQMLVLEVLDELGLEVREANDGPSALEIVGAEPRLDLLITDVGLPGMNGRQLVEEARRLRPDLKVLFVTGYADKAAMGEFEGENTDMITKPFALETLSDKVLEMLGAPGQASDDGESGGWGRA